MGVALINKAIPIIDALGVGIIAEAPLAKGACGIARCLHQSWQGLGTLLEALLLTVGIGFSDMQTGDQGKSGGRAYGRARIVLGEAHPFRGQDDYAGEFKSWRKSRSRR